MFIIASNFLVDWKVQLLIEFVPLNHNMLRLHLIFSIGTVSFRCCFVFALNVLQCAERFHYSRKLAGFKILNCLATVLVRIERAQ